VSKVVIIVESVLITDAWS